MNCKEIEIHAIEYMDGKLAGEELKSVDVHLASCGPCANRLRGFSDVSAMLGSWESIAPSASFDARLERRLASDEAPAMGWWQRFVLSLSWFPVGKPALAGALLGVALFGVVMARYYPGPSVHTTPVSTTAPIMASIAESNDELVPVLQNLDLVSNFEVLQDLSTTAR